MNTYRSENDHIFIKTKGIRAVVCMIIFAAVLFSALFIAFETGHDCQGAECPVCVSIQQCGQIIRGLGGAFAAVAVCVAFYALILDSSFTGTPVYTRASLVGLKIRLNI